MRQHRLGLLVGLCVLGACSSPSEPARDPERAPESDVIIPIPAPSEVFTLHGEVLSFRAAARRGDRVRAEISLAGLEKLVEFDDAFLIEYQPGNSRVVPSHVRGDLLVADLVGGNSYLIFPTPVGRLADLYRVLCRIDHIALTDRAILVDPICTRILCSPDRFLGQELLTEFPELVQYEELLDISRTELGGWDEPFVNMPGSGNICEHCEHYRPGGLYPIADCFVLPPTRTPSWQASVVNMIPQNLSAETNQDSEPFLAIDRTDSDCLAGSAFTPSPTGGTNAPIYITNNGGQTWNLNEIVPSQSTLTGTGDITMDTGNTSGEMYAGILQLPGSLDLTGLVTSDYKSATAMTETRSLAQGDQPFVRVLEGQIDDRVFVGLNDLAQFDNGTGGGTGRTATVDVSIDSGATFAAAPIETRSTGAAGQDGPSVRPAVAADGTTYAAFLGWRDRLTGPTGIPFESDVVVVRNDPGSTGAPFQDLTDPSDGLAGRLVETGRTMVFNGRLGQNRIGSTLSLAVSPVGSDEVWIAWADQTEDSDSTIHVRYSLDRGVNWTDDVKTLTNATNCALAINDDGHVGLLYQQVVNTRWHSVVEVSESRFNMGSAKLTLANTPSNAPTPVFQPYLGDYTHLLAEGLDFFGVFSANNTPDLANFPSGVSFQRNADFGAKLLRDGSGGTVPISIDPFFFHVTKN